MNRLIYEKSAPGRRADNLPRLTPAETALKLRIPHKYFREQAAELPRRVGRLAGRLVGLRAA